MVANVANWGAYLKGKNMGRYKYIKLKIA